LLTLAFRRVCGTAFAESGGRVSCLNVQRNHTIIGYYGSASSDVRITTNRGLVEVIDRGLAAGPDVLNVLSLPVFNTATVDIPVPR
jgi:hypothetical protein